MTLHISSFADKLNSYTYLELTQKPISQHYRSVLTADPVKNLDTNKVKPGSLDTEVSDQIIFSADLEVNYKVDPETNEVVILVVDSESGEEIRQIPGKEFLKLTQRIADFHQNHLDEIA